MQKIIFLSLLLYSLFAISFAGGVRGRVTDGTNNEMLIGCTVYVPELKIGVVSGLDGSFLLKNLPEGKYSLIIKYVGYSEVKMQIDLPDANTILKIDISLHPENTNLEEITVVGYSDKSTDKSARLSEKNSLNIINVMSAKSIELSPDLNVAAVIGRMSGVTLERGNSGEGQYAILRGMDKRYNYTLVNGVKIPSTDNKYRYLPLDIFPSDLVDRLEVTKALTPNMEGDAIGGAVNLVMKDAPDQLQIKANVAMGYSQMFLERDFMAFTTNAIQQKSPYETNGSGYKATENDFPKGNLDIKPKSFAPNQVAGLSIGNRFFNRKLGVLVAGSYAKNYKGNNSLFFDISTTGDERNAPKLESKEDRQYYEEQLQYGLHNKLDYRINSKNNIKLYNAFLSSESKKIRDLSTIEFNSYEPGNGTYTKNYETRNRYNIQKLYNSTLQGEHKLTDNFAVKWSGVFSIAENKSPDNTKISLVSDLKDYEEQHVYVVEKSCTRRWMRNSDQDLAGYLDVEYSPVLFNTLVKLSMGGLYRDKQRTSFYNQYTLIPTSDRPAPFQYFSEKGVEWNVYSEIKWNVLNPPDPTHSLNYDASESIIAGYFQFDFRVGKMQWFGGLRAENTNQGYILHFEQYGSDPIGNQTYTDLLPSLHLKYKVSENQNLRLSYYRAINRPGFLEIVPFQDKTDDYTEAGNAALKRATSDNIDLRYEIFPKEIDQFLVGFFYKNIHNPIEYAFIESGATQSIIYIPENFGTARNYGVEVDVTRYYRNFGIKANYTWTKSAITTTKLLKVRNELGNIEKTFPNQSRPLYGQSEHMANISFLYKNTKLNWDAQIAVSYASDRIAVVSQYLDNDVWGKGAVKLDISSEKRLYKGLSMFVKANNLLNTPEERYIKKVNPDFAEYPGQDAGSGKTLVRRDYFMSSYLLGIRFKFN